MLTWNLFKAELLKTYKLSINQILMVIMNVMGGFFYLSMILMAKVYGGGYLREAEVMLAFPRSIDLSIMTINHFGVLLAIIYMANNIGSEYGRDTWKMILPRYGSRLSFIATKILVALLAMLTLFVFTIGFWVTLSYLGAIFLHVNPTTQLTPGEKTTTEAFKALTMTALKMSFYGLLTALATTVARSVVGGVIAGMALSLTLATAISVPIQTFVRCMPSVHISNIEMQWTKNTRELEEISQAFGTVVSTQTSLCVVTASILLIIGLAFYIFSKRDIAGN
jgi:ABC-2 type transport system permease protein